MKAGLSRRIKVLLSCGSFNLGGSERNVVKIATGLDPERFAVTVLAFTGNGPLRGDLKAGGIPIIELDWSFDPRRLWPDFDRLRQAIERVSPDIIHMFNYPTIYFALAAGVMAEVPVRVVAIQALDTWKGWTEWITDRLSRSAVTLYLADGEGARQFVVRQQGLDPARVRLHYDGPDVEELVPSSPTAVLKRQLGLEADRPVVGLVGRLQDSHKGQSVFLRSVARLPADLEAQFVLVGGGLDEAALRGLARELGVEARVIFAGPRDRLADVLHALDVLVIPSLRYESVPKILLEGMAVGLPVVASRVGDIPEFLEDGVTGLAVGPGDPDALARAIRHLLVRPEMAKALGERARAALVSKGVTLRQSLHMLTDLYVSLVASRREKSGARIGARMRWAMRTYRVMRLSDERVRSLLGCS